MLFLLFAVIILNPPAVVEDGDVLDAGAIGPGQTLSLEINPSVEEGGTFGEGGIYDYAYIDDLPPLWSSKKSKLYESPLYLTLSAPPNASEGVYKARVVLVDEFNGDGLGNLSFFVKVRVKRDVLSGDVFPTEAVVSPGQPAVFNIFVENKGSAADVFEIGAEGAGRWDFKKYVFVAPNEKKIIRYEIVPQEEEFYYSSIYVRSTASSEIAFEKNISLRVLPTVSGDLTASSNGILLYPFFNLPLQAFATLISNVIG